MKRKAPYCKWKKRKWQLCFLPTKKSFPILICIFIMKVRSLPLGLVSEMNTRQFFMLYYFCTLNQILILFTWGFIFQSSEIVFILQFFSFFWFFRFFFLVIFRLFTFNYVSSFNYTSFNLGQLSSTFQIPLKGL